MDNLDRYKILHKTLKYFIFGVSTVAILFIVPSVKLSLDEILIIAAYSSFVYGLMEMNC
jgi:hypothetical protein